MLYAVACADWSPGSPLIPRMTRSRLFRTRAEARKVAPDHPMLAVAVTYDPTRGEVVARMPAARGLDGPWSAPAILDAAGGLIVLVPIPAALVRGLGPTSIRVHRGSDEIARSHLSGTTTSSLRSLSWIPWRSTRSGTQLRCTRPGTSRVETLPFPQPGEPTAGGMATEGRSDDEAKASLPASTPRPTSEANKMAS